jgi:hypothetical protein
VVGLLRRYRDGSKRSMGGGTRGITIPSGFKDRAGPVLLVEGPSDTAAALALGLRALGRPSNTGGMEHLAVLLSQQPPDTAILVVGENDAKRDGTWPGLEGARHTAGALARLLGREVRWALPPAGVKDMRAWVLKRKADPARPESWSAAGAELLAGLQENAQAAPAPGAEPPGLFRLIPCPDLKAVADDARWTWRGFLARGCVTLLSAYMKAGKTTLLTHLLRAFGDDGEFLDQEVQNSRVLYVTEEAESLWADRRDRLGLGDHLTFIVRPFRAKPNKAQWVQFLDYLHQVQEREHFDVLVFDTISNLWPVRDENNATEVREALMPLHSVMGDAALALVHHLRKGDGQEATGSRGSGDLVAFVDIILELRRYDAAEHANRRRTITGYSRWEQTPTQLVIELTDGGYEAVGSRAEVKAEDIAKALALALPEGPPGLSVDELRRSRPEVTAVRRQDLLAALAMGHADGRWARTGSGVRGSPYRYHKPAATSASDSPTPPPGGPSGADAIHPPAPDGGGNDHQNSKSSRVEAADSAPGLGPQAPLTGPDDQGGDSSNPADRHPDEEVF